MKQEPLSIKAVAVLEDNIALLKSKSSDYNAGPIDQRDYYIYGDKSIISEIWKKVLRLRSLAERADQGAPNHESLVDNCQDLANYAAILAAYYIEQREMAEVTVEAQR